MKAKWGCSARRDIATCPSTTAMDSNRHGCRDAVPVREETSLPVHPQLPWTAIDMDAEMECSARRDIATCPSTTTMDSNRHDRRDGVQGEKRDLYLSIHNYQRQQ